LLLLLLLLLLSLLLLLLLPRKEIASRKETLLRELQMLQSWELNEDIG